ncbi:hypothetical protein Hypma_003402 [Hypsizygus marmoreus]|uniref:Uncharacterized protein n=1 Tax=Hypsizygus marmoreus TaxID=39966 RepID=A0A369J3Y3_HYPMA|nr:hypothetical protein Hypma_003402 [Hypsizygus marmoreus]
MDEAKGDESRPASPAKSISIFRLFKFVATLPSSFASYHHHLHQEILTLRLQLDTQTTQITSLEAALDAHATPSLRCLRVRKDRLIQQQAKTSRELESVVRGEPLRKVREDVERDWEGNWERKRKMRVTLEEGRRALAAFVMKSDSLGLGIMSPSSSSSSTSLASKLKPPMPTPGGASAAFAERPAQTKS